MLKKIVSLTLLLLMVCAVFTGCSDSYEPEISELPTFNKSAGEETVADGFEILGGSWPAAAFYYKNKLIDLSDNDNLMDLYDTTYLHFYEGGTFHYMNIYNHRGKYIRQSEDTFILKTDTVFTYDFAEQGLVEVVKEDAEKTTYIITLLDENTLRWNVFDPVTGSEKSDSEPLLFEKEDSESQYILKNKTLLNDNSDSSSTVNSTPATPAPTVKPDYSGSNYGSNSTSTTSGMRNALSSAKNYLAVMPFSHKGLIEQLEFEGYSYSEAKYAADNCGADWNEQAARSAQNYLNVMSFSRTGLIEQLEFEGYTHAQAVYGVDEVY